MSTQEPPQYVWVVHPLFDSPKKSVFLVSFLIFLLVGIQFLFGSLGITLLSIVFLFGSLRQYFLPFRYEVYNNQITVSSFLSKQDRAWNEFRSYYVDQHGILLSPFPKPSRLENFRGIYVRFGLDRSMVLDLIQSKIEMDD
ncbi:TPA: hypothetical protein EYN98_31810 [Candidatus Poribacteria bacterium]|jgi:hypothetical protein|nr:hypothetical protein [Candidatus Poribacteria bacterium]HIA70552.1 hypothetical protein [Candidatus Poribacteria bacterium]HIB85664.1 hypothetical protein [Candidatus Poribacteria bacterium]HIC02537.1 hypothetical protein [Candidatus Poribacteria bacterium]HIC17846.1 hypothetical protein [Candidatus Poribacteria bacterium]